MDPITIEAHGTVLAYYFPHDLHAPNGTRFLNKQSEPLQVGLMEHPAGHHVRAHMHPAMERDIPTTSEFFFIQKGRARVTIYDNEWNEVALQELVDGDSMLILGGGHEVEMLEETRMFEIKQGPYPGDEKAKIFRPDL